MATLLETAEFKARIAALEKRVERLESRGRRLDRTTVTVRTGELPGDGNPLYCVARMDTPTGGRPTYSRGATQGLESSDEAVLTAIDQLTGTFGLMAGPSDIDLHLHKDHKLLAHELQTGLASPDRSEVHQGLLERVCHNVAIRYVRLVDEEDDPRMEEIEREIVEIQERCLAQAE